MQTIRQIASAFLVVLAGGIAFAATPQMSAELQKAIAAAERARATPKGQAYQDAFNTSLRDVMISGMKDCLPINAPGVRKPSGFQCVLILGKTGKPKWIIRDSRDAMA